MAATQELLGLSLETALLRLGEMGITPQVDVTCAPRRREDARGELRVVRIAQDGAQLTAARFINPLAEGRQEKKR